MTANAPEEARTLSLRISNQLSQRSKHLVLVIHDNGIALAPSHATHLITPRDFRPLQRPLVYTWFGTSLIAAGMLLSASAALAQQPVRPLPKVAGCPLGYYSSGSYCVPSTSGNTRGAIEKSGAGCPLGFYSSGHYCLSSPRSQVRILSPRLVTARVLGNTGSPFFLCARESAREQGGSGLALLTCGHGARSLRCWQSLAVWPAASSMAWSRTTRADRYPGAALGRGHFRSTLVSACT